MSHHIRFIDRGTTAKQPADKRYPDGIHLDMSHGATLSCLVALPHPAPRCGYWRVVCDDCGFAVAVTTAGRADDPKTVRVPCSTPEKSRLQ